MRALAESHEIDLDDSFAYSDSATDVPMLALVGHPFCVNPDRALSKVAAERDWPTLSFTTKVRVHDRSRSRTPVLVSAVVIGIAALLGRTQIRRDG